MIAVSLLVAILPVADAAPQAGADFTALRAYVDEYQRAWNAHDPAAVAAFFAEDADLVPCNLPAVRGREAIRAWWRGYFEAQERERRATFEISSARRLTPTVSLIDVVTTTAGEGGEGAPLPVRRARATWLLSRRTGAWLISAMRGLPTEEDRVELASSLEITESLRPTVRAFVAGYEDTFNRHDPDALSALYSDDADIIVRNLPATHGARAIRDWWGAYFGQPRPYRALFIIEEIRMMADDVALLNIIATGAPLEATGRAVPTRQARATWVLLREDGQWLIAALRVLPGEGDRVIRGSAR